MPQMAPLNWIILFIIFILTFLLFNMMNYYCFQLKILSTKKKMFLTKKINWKW